MEKSSTLLFRIWWQLWVFLIFLTSKLKQGLWSLLKWGGSSVWAPIKIMKGKHDVCDSLVSSKLCDFVLKYLLNSQSFSRMISFAQMKIWGHICWGKTVLTETFPDYFHSCQNMMNLLFLNVVCSSWPLIFWEYSGNRGLGKGHCIIL